MPPTLFLIAQRAIARRLNMFSFIFLNGPIACQGPAVMWMSDLAEWQGHHACECGALTIR
jgi:hypothetical protein